MMLFSRQGRYVCLAALLLTAGCTNDTTPATDEVLPSSTVTQGSSVTETTLASPAEDAGSIADNDLAVLPTRDGPRRETTGSVPHVQIDAVPVPEVDADLRRRAYLLPGVEDRETQISQRGARALWLADDIELVRPEILLAGREFGHIHPDGSLHLWLPVDRAQEVAATKWGELHPWVDRDNFWDGVVMIYTPETLEEVDVTIQLVVDAYNYIAGATLDPASFD